jgi:hypothetical protein
MTRNEQRAQLRELLHEVWDDGNCAGIDGWIGEGMCTGEVDDEAIRSRDRVVDKVLPRLLNLLVPGGV